jgi:UTP--glucose-1-phosphate uridylyltransferase
MNQVSELKSKLDQILNPTEINEFLNLVKKFQEGAAIIFNWNSVKGPDPLKLPRYEKLPLPDQSKLEKALQKLVVCKLNGGLGTSMGCSGPKSAIPVRDSKSFLDLIIEQIDSLNREYNISVPLVLMNSFRTFEETEKIIAKYNGDLKISGFLQNKFPRLEADTLSPLSEDEYGIEAWYPPGHGDLYNCIKNQGLLDNWLEQGKEIVFISNSDNLGATVDPRIASFLLDDGPSFILEVSEKTLADIKGGTLYEANGKLGLLEAAQVPPEGMDEFCGVDKFKTFNTNSIWINLVRLKEKLNEGSLDFPVIANPKTIQNTNALQLETAMGFAVGLFDDAMGLVVPRSRFLPVKKTSDLFVVQSNVFNLEKGRLLRNPAREMEALPLVTFGKELNDYETYRNSFDEIPDLLELESLKLDGEFQFGENVVLKGNVELGSKGEVHKVPKGTVINT